MAFNALGPSVGGMGAKRHQPIILRKTRVSVSTALPFPHYLPQPQRQHFLSLASKKTPRLSVTSQPPRAPAAPLAAAAAYQPPPPPLKRVPRMSVEVENLRGVLSQTQPTLVPPSMQGAPLNTAQRAFLRQTGTRVETAQFTFTFCAF